MNRKLMLIGAAGMMAASSATFAAGELYGTLSYANLSTDALDALKVSGVTVDDDDSEMMLGVGYRLTDNLAVEAAMGMGSEVSATTSGTVTGTLYGKSYTATGSVKVSAETDNSFMLGGVYSAPINNQFSLNAKAGLLFWDVDYIASASGTLTYDGTSYSGSTSETFLSKDGEDLYYGIGAAYAASEDVDIRADYMRTEIDDADIDVISLAAVVNF